MQSQVSPRHVTLENTIKDTGTQAARVSQGQSVNTFLLDGKQSPLFSLKQGTWKRIVNPGAKGGKTDNLEPGNSSIPQKRNHEV